MQWATTFPSCPCSPKGVYFIMLAGRVVGVPASLSLFRAPYAILSFNPPRNVVNLGLVWRLSVCAQCWNASASYPRRATIPAHAKARERHAETASALTSRSRCGVPLSSLCGCAAAHDHFVTKSEQKHFTALALSGQRASIDVGIFCVGYLGSYKDAKKSSQF